MGVSSNCFISALTASSSSSGRYFATFKNSTRSSELPGHPPNRLATSYCYWTGASPQMLPKNPPTWHVVPCVWLSSCFLEYPANYSNCSAEAPNRGAVLVFVIFKKKIPQGPVYVDMLWTCWLLLAHYRGGSQWHHIGQERLHLTSSLGTSYWVREIADAVGRVLL